MSSASQLPSSGHFPIAAVVPGVAAGLPSTGLPSTGQPSTGRPSTGRSSTGQPTRTNVATPHSSAPQPLPTLARSVIWNVPFDQVSLDEAVDRIGLLIQRRDPSYVITANLNYVMLHNQSTDMHPITADAGLILADGQPIVWRSKIGTAELPERVAGSEMIYSLAQQASLKGWKIYFLGGEPGVAAVCAERLVKMYPGLQVAGVESPPFRKLSAEEQLAQDQRIQEAGTDLLLVAFGQPKGERWIHQNYQRLSVPVSIQLGASFDFIAGTAIRAPKIWQKLGLEWAYRMMSDPRRLVPRYVGNAWFLVTALVNDWKRKVSSWGMGIE